MSRIPPIAWLIASLCLLGAGACLFKAGLPGLLPKRGKRRAGPRRSAPFQLAGLPPMRRRHLRGRHDWDGFLHSLTNGEPLEQAEPRTEQPAPDRTRQSEAVAATQPTTDADQADQVADNPREGEGDQTT